MLPSVIMKEIHVRYQNVNWTLKALGLLSLSKVTNWYSSPKKSWFLNLVLFRTCLTWCWTQNIFYLYMASNQCYFGHSSKYLFLHFPRLKQHESESMMTVFMFGWTIPRNKTFRDAVLPPHQTGLSWLQQLHWNTADAVCFSHPASLHCLCCTKSIYSKPRFVSY